MKQKQHEKNVLNHQYSLLRLSPNEKVYLEKKILMEMFSLHFCCLVTVSRS